jgi:trans-aconitate methyltransferase
LEKINNWLSRTKDEYKYFTNRPWTLEEVGFFWDSVEEYDDINDKLYPYFKRFTNSEELLMEATTLDYQTVHRVLDIQTRSGRGTKYWIDKFRNASFICVDFSEGLLLKAKQRLNSYSNVEFKKTITSTFDLHEKFDVILCYETVEHVYDYEVFIHNLSDHLKSDGIIVLTCPNVSWEIVHWVTAIVGFNHSEGPHRFIKYSKLIDTFRKSNLKVMKYNSTIFFPFNNRFSIFLDCLFTRYLPTWIKRKIMLRHSFILGKL